MTESGPPHYVDAATITACLPPEAAVEAVLAGLRGEVDPAADVPRSHIPVQQGDLLLMPAQSAASVGVKLATVAPDNPARGLPRISAVYVMFDAATLRVTHLLDGVALTNLRTPAVSVAAVKPWLDLVDEPLRVVVFGGGPQGLGHLETVAAVHDIATSVGGGPAAGSGPTAGVAGRCSGPGGRRCQGVEAARGGPRRRLCHHGPYAAVRLAGCSATARSSSPSVRTKPRRGRWTPPSASGPA